MFDTIPVYQDIGLLRELFDPNDRRPSKCRPLERHREPKDHVAKKKKAAKMAKASRRRNRR